MPCIATKVSGTQRPLTYTRLTLLQNELNTKNSNFGRIPITKDEDVDTRSNYSTFINCLDLNDNTIMPRMVYECDRLRDDQEEDRVVLSNRSKKPFHLFMSSTYMKQTFDVDVECESDYRNMQNFQLEMKNLLTMTVEDMMRFKQGCFLNAMLRGGSRDYSIDDSDTEECCIDDAQDTATELSSYPTLCTSDSNIFQSESTANPIEESMFDKDSGLQMESMTSTTFHESQLDCESTRLQNGSMTLNSDSECGTRPVLTQSQESGIDSEYLPASMEDDPEVQFINSTASTQVVPISNRNISIDEGLGGSNSSLSLQSIGIYSPSVELFDIFDGAHGKVSPEMIKAIVLSLDSVQMQDIFGVRREYLTVQQQFNLPGEIFERETPLTVNILKLPERRLRKKKLFELPAEFNIWKHSVGCNT